MYPDLPGHTWCGIYYFSWINWYCYPTFPINAVSSIYSGNNKSYVLKKKKPTKRSFNKKGNFRMFPLKTTQLDIFPTRPQKKKSEANLVSVQCIFRMDKMLTSAAWPHTCTTTTAWFHSCCKPKCPGLNYEYYEGSAGVAWATSIPGDHHEMKLCNSLRTAFWTKARMHNACSQSKQVPRLALHSFKFLIFIKDISRHLLLNPHARNIL